MIKAIKLEKKYQDFLALNKLDLEIKEGEIFCLLGANGAGKTTTINLFLGFIGASSGDAYINNLNVKTDALKTKEFLAYIPENLELYPNLTAIENLSYFSGLAKKNYTRKEYESILSQASLQANAFDKQIRHFSKGMRQKVGIAIALAKKAKALFLDEPTSGLDPKSSNEFSGLLQELSKNGTAILMATHDIFRAKEVGSHVGIMREGELVENLTTDEINHQDLESIYLKAMEFSNDGHKTAISI